MTRRYRVAMAALLALAAMLAFAVFFIAAGSGTDKFKVESLEELGFIPPSLGQLDIRGSAMVDVCPMYRHQSIIVFGTADVASLRELAITDDWMELLPGVDPMDNLELLLAKHKIDPDAEQVVFRAKDQRIASRSQEVLYQLYYREDDGRFLMWTRIPWSEVKNRYGGIQSRRP